MGDRSIHDAAFDLSRKMLEVVRPCLRDDEVDEILRRFYDLARDCLRKFADEAERERKRLRPLDGR